MAPTCRLLKGALKNRINALCCFLYCKGSMTYRS